MADWNVSVRESLNRGEKTVDVTLRFIPSRGNPTKSLTHYSIPFQIKVI